MHIFFYDKTFEGLLTAIFDAYTHRTFPDRLLRVGEPAPLFADTTYTVVTDTPGPNASASDSCASSPPKPPP